MTGNKRERDVARAKYERQQAKKAAEDAARRRRTTIIASIVGLAAIAAGSVWLVKSNASDSPPVVAVSPSPTPSTAPSRTPSAAASKPVSPNPSGTIKGVTCTTAPATRPDNIHFPSNQAPALFQKTSRNYIVLTTNCGDIEITLNTAKALKTSTVMSWLTNEKFFDATACHRVTTQEFYVAQCGDPKGDGTGRPGFSFADENLPAAGTGNYPAGTVAMANSGPNSNGSQFFIVYKDSTLPNAYSQWGTVTKGLNIVQYVAEQGTVNATKDGKPKQPLVIIKAQTFAENSVPPTP